MKKQDTRVVCPNCGVEFAIADKEHTVKNATVIGKDSGLGTIYPEIEKGAQTGLPKSAAERIEALRNAGVDVSHLFAMTGANGGEFVASNKDGNLVFLADTDPIFDIIKKGGDIPNRKLFRRWVMAQMFAMLGACDYRGNKLSITDCIHRKGYEYQWKMLINELHAQAAMVKNGDKENFDDRKRWFNPELAHIMAEHYIFQLMKHVDNLTVKKCKGVPYKRVAGNNIFCEDLHVKLFNPLQKVSRSIRFASTAQELYKLVLQFEEMRPKMKWDTPQCEAWVDAYKGSGAYFTMQNLIRFHGCKFRDAGKFMSKTQSLALLKLKADEYAGEGWRLIGLMKKFLSDNAVDVAAKRREWRAMAAAKRRF